MGLPLKKCQKYISCELALDKTNKNSNINNIKKGISFLDRNHDRKIISIEIKNWLTLCINTEYLTYSETN